jgi:hypothetical protein
MVYKMNEESAISAGVAPTNAVGTGVETSLPPAVEPPGRLKGSKIIRRKPKKKIYESTMTYAFQVKLAGVGEVILYGKTETEVKNKLRKYFRDYGQIINIKRIFPTEVIDFYTQKRSKALKRIADVVLEASMNQTAIPSPQPLANTLDNPQKAKQDQSKKQQVAKTDAQKRIALAKQNMQKQLQQKKVEMQKRLQSQQKTLQQNAKSGSLDSTQS